MQEKIERNEKININLEKLKKRLPPDVLKYIQPGSNWGKVKETLGEPDFHVDSAMGNFTDPSDPITTNCYLYKFLNSNLKITTNDNVSIDTISVFRNENQHGSKYEIELPFPVDYGKKGYLGVTKITTSFLDTHKKHYANRTAREVIFGLETYGGWASNYLSYSYFGYYLKDLDSYEKSQDSKIFIGSTIDGVCISRVETFAPTISIYE